MMMYLQYIVQPYPAHPVLQVLWKIKKTQYIEKMPFLCEHETSQENGYYHSTTTEGVGLLHTDDKW